jgi:hypothetical protein
MKQISYRTSWTTDTQTLWPTPDHEPKQGTDQRTLERGQQPASVGEHEWPRSVVVSGQVSLTRDAQRPLRFRRPNGVFNNRNCSCGGGDCGGFAGKPGVGHTSQPFLPPRQVAIGLAHAMCGAIATQPVQEHEAAHALEARAMDPVMCACLSRPPSPA